MAKYTKGMLVFGLGVLVVSTWCMKGIEASSGDNDDDDLHVHSVKREPEGCGTKNSEGGIEECSGEDDHLGLYADVDDTYRSALKKLQAQFHHDDVDSPHVGNSDVNVMGH